jgi:hypothetical protein
VSNHAYLPVPSLSPAQMSFSDAGASRYSSQDVRDPEDPHGPDPPQQAVLVSYATLSLRRGISRRLYRPLQNILWPAVLFRVSELLRLFAAPSAQSVQICPGGRADADMYQTQGARLPTVSQTTPIH